VKFSIQEEKKVEDELPQCPNGHLGGQYGCDFCNCGVADKSGTNNLNMFLKEQGWEKYDIMKHYMLGKDEQEQAEAEKAKDADDEKKGTHKYHGSIF
jgi:hypothetical protein